MSGSELSGTGLGSASGERLGIRLATALWLATGLPMLASCSSPSAPPPAMAQFSLNAQDLVGKWGLASYRVDTDLDRTKAEAKRACSNPYVVTAGADGGVMMHLADQAAPTNVVVKTGPDGGVFIGPPGKPGDRRDRQVVSYGDGTMVAKWVDPDAATRYGTMVFVRCAAA